MKAQPPYISVIFIVDRLRERGQRALRSILDQDGIEQAEVLLLDLGHEKFAPLQGSDHSRVRLIKQPTLPSFSDIQVHATSMARGEVVAFVEDHVVVVPGWLQTLIRDFRAGYTGVGGEPGALNPRVGISDAVSLMNYAYFHPVPEPRLSKLLPGHNSAYRRDVLLSFGDLLGRLLANEALLNWKMTERGHTLLLDRGAKFLHYNEEHTSLIARGYYYWNLNFGEGRAIVFNWRWPRRLLQLLAFPAVPVLRFVKLFIYLMRHDRSRLQSLFRFAGTILYAQAAAALGMGIGAVFGAGDAGVRFLEYELNIDRMDGSEPARSL